MRGDIIMEITTQKKEVVLFASLITFFESLDNNLQMDRIKGVLDFTEEVIYSNELKLELAKNNAEVFLTESLAEELFKYLDCDEEIKWISEDRIKSKMGKRCVRMINLFKYKNQQALKIKNAKREKPFMLLSFGVKFDSSSKDQFVEVNRIDGESLLIKMDCTELMNVSTHIDVLLTNIFKNGVYEFIDDDVESYQEARNKVYTQISKIKAEAQGK
ncbi:MAG: hypothetical protein N4A45_09495 [Flavobacteriales bacterium]|jgi:hypothetical protein|nr:hypothetical protein [Flavobacteriales bacterium]